MGVPDQSRIKPKSKWPEIKKAKKRSGRIPPVVTPANRAPKQKGK